MMQIPLNFSRRLPPNPYKPDTQCHALYEWLEKYGAITLHEIHHTLKIDTARIRTDVRGFLRKHGLDYIVKAIPGTSNRLYKIR
jgi:hypothetical protein